MVLVQGSGFLNSGYRGRRVFKQMVSSGVWHELLIPAFCMSGLGEPHRTRSPARADVGLYGTELGARSKTI